jgi:hypothetical protein
MNPLPASNLRSNIATWAAPACQAPAITAVLLDLLQREPFDPAFRGQTLKTLYFDTADRALRKARIKGNAYLTLRLRCYEAEGRPEAYAASAKTETIKQRWTIDHDQAEFFKSNPAQAWPQLLTADLLARLLELTDRSPLLPAVCIDATRYAVEDDQDRITLDLDVRTDTGKCLPSGVVEFKSTDKNTPPPASLLALPLRPIKLSKFLWATDWRA